MKRAWEIPLRAYVTEAKVVSPPAGAGMDGRSALLRTYKSIDRWEEVSVPERPDVRFLSGGRDILMAIDPESGEVIGGVTGFYPYVLPEHRGRNLNAEMNMIQDEQGRRRPVSSYTPSGFGSRVATHRLHLERAMAAGHEIPSEVMVDYEIRDGKPTLRKSYGPEEHNAWCEAVRIQKIRERHARQTEGCSEVFMTAEDAISGIFDEFDPNGGGYILAIALHRETGAGFLAHHQGSRVTVQFELDGLVVDALGARPSQDAMADLERRGQLMSATRQRDPFFGEIHVPEVEVRRYASEAELLEGLSENIGNFAIPEFSEDKLRSAQLSESFMRIMASRVLAADTMMRRDSDIVAAEPGMDVPLM